MQIKSVKIYGFGGLVDKYYRFKEGINVLCLDKSEDSKAVLDFIYAMLYGIGGSEDSTLRQKYRPSALIDDQGKPVKFGGELVFECDGTTYNEVCIWDGIDPKKDERTTNDYYTGRIVRLVGDKSAGEQLLRIPAETFKGALYRRNTPVFKENETGVVLAELSACSGIDGEMKTGKAALEDIESEIARIKSPKGKNGELDSLIITKMNMQNELTRLSDTDNKISVKRAELDELNEKYVVLKENEKDHKRLLNMAKASRELIIKDKYNMLQKGMDTLNDDIEEKKTSYETALARRSSPLIIAAGAVFAAIGVAAVIMFLTSNQAKTFADYAILVCGAILIAIGALLSGVAIYRKKTGSKGKKIEALEAEIENLTNQIQEKQDAIDECLHGRDEETAERDWSDCRNALSDTTDEERRYVVSRPVEDFEADLKSIVDALVPVQSTMSDLVREMHALKASANVSFSDIMAATEGIDEKIGALTEKYKKLDLARAAIEEADAEIKATFIPKLISETERIFEKVAGGKIKITIDDNYAICAKTLESGDVSVRYGGAWTEIVYMTLSIALSRTLSPKGEFFSLLLDDVFANIEKEKLDVLIKYLAAYEAQAEALDAGIHTGTQILMSAGKSEIIAGDGVSIVK